MLFPIWCRCLATVLLGAAIVAATATAEPLEVLPRAEGGPPAAAARVAPGLTLCDFLALASRNNPTLRQADAQVAAGYGKAVEAGLYPNPTVGYSGDQIGADGTAGEFQGGFAQQEIVTAGKLQLSRQKYLARAKAAEWQAAGQQARVHNDVRASFYQALGASELAGIRRELVKAAEDNLLTTKERLNVGQANNADVHLAQAHRQRAKLELMAAENEFHEAWEQLSAMAGIDLPVQPLVGEFDGEIAVCEWETLLERLLLSSPELAAAQAKLQADRITVQRERVQPIPNVTVRGAAGHNFELGQTVYAAQLSVPLPLFDRNQGTIQQAQADLNRQEAEVRRIELELRHRLAAEYRRYRTAYQHVALYQTDVLPEVRHAYELRLKAYQENRESWPNVLATQQEYFMRRAEYVQQVVHFRRSESLVNGFLLQGGLHAAPAPTPPGHIDAVPKPR